MKLTEVKIALTNRKTVIAAETRQIIRRWKEIELKILQIAILNDSSDILLDNLI